MAHDHSPDTCTGLAELRPRVATLETNATAHAEQILELRLWKARIVGYVAGGVMAGTVLSRLIFDWLPAILQRGAP